MTAKEPSAAKRIAELERENQHLRRRVAELEAAKAPMPKGSTRKARRGEEASYVRRIGWRLHVLRFERGWTQQELAEFVGVTQTTVGTWERGLVVPRVDAMIALADAFGVRPAHIFTFERRLGEP